MQSFYHVKNVDVVLELQRFYRCLDLNVAGQ